MIEDYNGATVIDAAGERIGTVERSYVTDDGVVQVVRVKLGKLFAKHRLVPVDGLRPQDDVIRLPYTKQLVEAAPEIDADDDLGGALLAQIRRHYATLREVPMVVDASGDEEARPMTTRSGPASDHAALPSTGGIADDGEMIEIPIVEEELVKRPVVKEVLRVRKETITRQQPVETTLRREELVVDDQGDVDIVHDDAIASGDSRPEPPPTLEELRRIRSHAGAAQGPDMQGGAVDRQ